MTLTSSRTPHPKPGREPEVTPSILANIPDCLRQVLVETADNSKKRKKSILISSNSLANRFILERWGIRPSQRRKFRNLFSQIRKHCRKIFDHLLNRKRMDFDMNSNRYLFGIYKFDEVRGNTILAFVQVPEKQGWTLPYK